MKLGNKFKVLVLAFMMLILIGTNKLSAAEGVNQEAVQNEITTSSAITDVQTHNIQQMLEPMETTTTMQAVNIEQTTPSAIEQGVTTTQAIAVEEQTTTPPAIEVIKVPAVASITYEIQRRLKDSSFSGVLRVTNPATYSMRVSYIKVVEENNWKLVDYSVIRNISKINLKYFGIQLNNETLSADTNTVSTVKGILIGPGETVELPLKLLISAQNKAVKEVLFSVKIILEP